jgi:hypothetical protein
MWSIVEQFAKDIGIERLGAHDLPPYLQQTFQAGRRVGTDQASSAVQFDPNDRGYVGFA